ncbi:MAG: hypothetical protein ACJ763_01175 [Bdellovibrionia bacterium]
MRTFSRIPYLWLALLLSGCSLKSPSGMKTIQIRLPSTSHSAALVKPVNKSLAIAAPTALSDFTCFGVKVTGPGISDDSRMGCAPPDGIGIVGGLIPSSGGSIDLTVPAGPGRKIVVFGAQSAEGCTSMEDLLSRPTVGRFSKFGGFYALGETSVDIVEDTSVTIKVAFTGSNSQVFAGCSVDATVSQPGLLTVSSGFANHASGGSGVNKVSANMIVGRPLHINGGQASGGVGSNRVIWKRVDDQGNPW